MFEQVLQTIRGYDRVIIHRHTNPDGDALGSQIGLKHILRENFPGKEILTVGDDARRYGFMDDSVMDNVPDEAYSGALAIILDTSSKALISDGRYVLAAKTVRIDHHIFCEKIADVEVTDTGFESCCGLIAMFAMECGLTVPPLAAKSLYTGMVTDSGRFRYDSTTAQTFRLAAFLREQPFDTNEIYRNLYASDLEQVQLKARFSLKIQLTEHHVAYIYTDLAEMESLNADTFTVSRGMVATMADIQGVDIWVNFTETEKGVLCELRSSRYNINPIAVKYGGGGHAKASGATVASREDAMSMLRDLDLLAQEAV
ncbi:MAG: bifunctional oligoribonuclease/PAP phosphatase NrnA [Firmicutes bacterium]|nr:bifunctional oligoribonuclease/PAP phosphatase NrnA [Bacillota bacterium]